jgi:hypothetical protein
MKASIFWDIILCDPLKANQLIFNVLHGIVSQKTELYITTAVTASHPAQCGCSLLHDHRRKSVGGALSIDSLYLNRTSSLITINRQHICITFYKNCQNSLPSSFKHALKHVNKFFDTFHSSENNNSLSTYNTPHNFNAV